MGLVNKLVPHYTYNDWVLWEGKWELIDGYPIAMSPSPVPAHQRAVARMIGALLNALETAGCKECNVYDALDYKITRDTVVIPDVLIVCGEIKKKYLDFPPALVVEILSQSTALKDRHTKFELYQLQGVKYYIIADPGKKTMDIFELKDKVYEPASSSRFRLEDDCIIKPDLSNIFR